VKLDDAAWHQLLRLRATDPAATAGAWAGRKRRPLLRPNGKVFLVDAGEPARGILSVGGDKLAMGNRRDLLTRLLAALEHPRVDGVLASPDVLDDLVLLGALNGRLAFGSASGSDGWLSGYDPRTVVEQGLDGAAMPLRVDLDDRRPLGRCAEWITELARAAVPALVEPMPSGGGLTPNWSEVALTRAVCVVAGLGASSAWTWLTLRAGPPTPAACAATTLPVLVRDAEPSGDLSTDLATRRAALAVPTVRGLIAGRALLYPLDDNVYRAIDTAARTLA
jgi:hypothetical protein